MMIEKNEVPEILVVDDEPENVVLLERILKASGYEVRAAYDGAEALQTVESGNPDIVLLDLMLPDMSGYEVCSRLHNNPETQHIPVIIITAHGPETSAKVKGLRSGANDYLTRPIDPDELLARIETQIRLKELENQRVLAEKLITIDQMVATLQHEINNPLTGVLGYSYILLAQIRSEEVPMSQIEKALVTILESGERIKEVMDKLRSITSPILREYAPGESMIDLEHSH